MKKFLSDKENATILTISVIAFIIGCLAINPIISFLIIGVADFFLFLPDLKKKIKEYHLQDRVHLLGHKTDVENYIDIADVMVLPSYFETFGLVLAEGMAMQKPAIAFNVGGISEVISDKETGFLVKYNDDDDLVNKINILAQDKDLCSKMGINARKKVEKDFANQIMIKKIIEIYNEIIDNKTN